MIASFEERPKGDAASWDASGWARRPAWPRLVAIFGWTAVAAAVATLVWMVASGTKQLREAETVADRDVPRRMAMRAPSLTGRLDDGRAYRIVAANATLEPGGDDVILLENVQAATQLNNGDRVDIVANRARVDRLRDRVEFIDDIVAVRSDGYRLATDAAELWQAQGGIAARSDRPVRISGPKGRATAAGLTATPGLSVIRLTGPVRLDIDGRTSN